MKIDILVLVYCSLLLTNLFARQVEVKEYSSPAEFNKKITQNSIKLPTINIDERRINKDQKNIIFYDKQGTELKSLSTFRYKSNHIVYIDYDHKEVFVSSPKFLSNTNFETGTEYYLTDVYDSTGVLKMSFKDDYFIIRRLSKSYYITIPGYAHDNQYKKSFLVDENGQKVKAIDDLFVPIVRNRNKSIVIVEDILKERLWTFNSSGELLWNKKLKINKKISLSENNRICVTSLDKVTILNERGVMINQIPITTYDGGVIAQISTDGKKLFWGNWSRRVGNIIPYRKCEIALYDLEKNKVVWDSNLIPEKNYGWLPLEIGLSYENDYAYVIFYNTYLNIYNENGTIVFEKPIEKNESKYLTAQFIQNTLVIKNSLLNTIYTISLKGK